MEARVRYLISSLLAFLFLSSFLIGADRPLQPMGTLPPETPLSVPEEPIGDVYPPTLLTRDVVFACYGQGAQRSAALTACADSEQSVSLQAQWRFLAADDWDPAEGDLEWGRTRPCPDQTYLSDSTCCQANGDSFYVRLRLKDVAGNISGWYYIDTLMALIDTTPASVDTVWNCYTPSDSTLSINLALSFTGGSARLKAQWAQPADRPSWTPFDAAYGGYSLDPQVTLFTERACVESDSFYVRYKYDSVYSCLESAWIYIPHQFPASPPVPTQAYISGVQGEIWEGETLTIIGNHFGFRAAAADEPIALNDFDAYTPGAVFVNTAHLKNLAPGVNSAHISNLYSHSGANSIYWTNAEDGGDYQFGGLYSYWGGAYSDQVFLCAHVRFSSLAGMNATGVFSLMAAPYDETADCSTGWPTWEIPRGYPQVWNKHYRNGPYWYGMIQVRPGQSLGTTGSPYSASYEPDQFQVYQLWADYGTIDTEDGILGGRSNTTYYDNKAKLVAATGTGTCETRKGFRAGLFPFRMSANPSVLCYFDDVYADTTLARVEIHNTSEWEACTEIAMQEPFYWHTDTIKVTINQAGFPTCGSSWLFVVTAGDTVVGPVEIKWGEYRDGL